MENLQMSYIGKELTRLRKNKNLTQLQLSRLCNINRTYISMLECNSKRPMLGTIFLLAAGLGMTACELVQEIEKVM
ncbi:helix-turn-helix transcriptional regulator [Neobacillus sp. OS1-2]|uniref:helix-turn-helix domain-containing protein n=1 Tax=Neobacillus sp. OS1-2 TaxID=3070680 RepID=UPI0027DECBA9|nr:helix-turn-helix transcriptional regulator [Neobacillus sp. OS1-2]WML41515.1 helix-turn-helix transcriptional regulator [Neobacillus sp. OS1-2]